jgi:hypothetical protein
VKPRTLHPLESHAPTREEVLNWVGSRVTDELGKPVGKVEDVLSTGERVEWLLIRHRRANHLLAPVAGAVGGGRSVFLPYPGERIATAPDVPAGRTADPETLARAREHYGLGSEGRRLAGADGDRPNPPEGGGDRLG